MKDINNVLIGADPELFLAKNGVIISAEGLIGGTKQDPKAISKEGHYIQEDNIMIEFNIPPCNSSDDFILNINFVKDYLEQLARILDSELNYSASAYIDKKYLKTKQAKMFGCDPDFNVYLKDFNNPPSSKTNLRSCGGHIHIGYDNPSVEKSEQLIYAMDYCLGLDSLLLDPDNKRRKMYGNAGSFRFKDYGVEYRTLSNFWIQNEDLMKWTFNNSLKAVELVNSGNINYIIENFSDEIRNIIDKNLKENVKSLKEKIEKSLKKQIA